MEYLLGVIATGVIELIKLTSQRFGKELGRAMILLLLFVLIFLAHVVINSGAISKELMENFVVSFSASIALYQVLIKPISEQFKLNEE